MPRLTDSTEMDATFVSTLSTRSAMDGRLRVAPAPPPLDTWLEVCAAWSAADSAGEGGAGAGTTTVGKSNAGGLSGTGVRVGVGGSGVAVGAGAGDEHAAISAVSARMASASAAPSAENGPLSRRFRNIRRLESDTRKPHPH